MLQLRTLELLMKLRLTATECHLWTTLLHYIINRIKSIKKSTCFVLLVQTLVNCE